MLPFSYAADMNLPWWKKMTNSVGVAYRLHIIIRRKQANLTEAMCDHAEYWLVLKVYSRMEQFGTGRLRSTSVASKS